MAPTQRELTIDVGDLGSVSAILMRPDEAVALYVLGHGAGAGMHHRFMDAAAEKLGARGIATLRYQFPYSEAGKKRPDSPRKLEATVRAAIEAAGREAGDLPRIAGGKSMGGRITSQAQAAEPLPGILGIAFLGFPLHAAGKVSRARGEHLADTGVPLLFVQGDRDKLADLGELRSVLEPIGDRARLHVIEGGDHSFHVLVRSGRSDDEALDDLADAVDDWVRGVVLTGASDPC